MAIMTVYPGNTEYRPPRSRYDRGGAEKLDSRISDNLAQSKPWNPRHTEEQEHEKESRTEIQGKGGNSSAQGQQSSAQFEPVINFVFEA